MTRTERNQVVLLLRCAADSDWGLADVYRWLDVPFGLFCTAHYLRRSVADQMTEYDYNYSCLETALLVEEGALP